VLLHMAGLPQNMWGEALCHSTWLKNRTSTWALGGKTPWQALYGTPPNLSGLKRFGEAVWVHNCYVPRPFYLIFLFYRLFLI